MNLLKKILIILFCVTCLVGCDISTKQIAQKELKGQSIQTYLGGFVQLVYVENPGGMLSFGYNLSGGLRFIIFQVFISVVLAVLFLYLLFNKKINKFQTVSFLLFISGGIGNLIDRFTNNGKVIDFIVLQVNDLHSGVFNFADLYIIVGVAVLIISSFKKDSKSIKGIQSL
jgi:signal peptidase II